MGTERMNCSNMITHVVKQGDSLYGIARMHNTTVEELQALNPGLNPYNLQVGTVLKVCEVERMLPQPGLGPEIPSPMPTLPTMPDYSDSQMWMDLNESVRLSWLQHVYWTRALIVSLMGRMGDQQAVEERLMRNPADIAAVYRGDFPTAQVDQLQQLLYTHLQIGAALVEAVMSSRVDRVEELNRQWYANADQLAAAFAAMSPYYDQTELRRMLYGHLALLKQQIFSRLDKKYQEEIRAFDAGEKHILTLADYLAQGLAKQVLLRS